MFVCEKCADIVCLPSRNADLHQDKNNLNVTVELTPLPLDKMAAILADDIFKHIFLNENVRIPIQISLAFVPKGLIDNTSALI